MAGAVCQKAVCCCEASTVGCGLGPSCVGGTMGQLHVFRFVWMSAMQVRSLSSIDRMQHGFPVQYVSSSSCR